MLFYVFKGSTPFTDLFIQRNIFISFNTRCCKTHIDDCGLISDNDIQNITIVEHRVKLTGEQLSKLFYHIQERDAYASTLFNQLKEIDKAPSKLIIDHTGFTKEEFFFL